MNWSLPENIATYGGRIDAVFWVITIVTAIAFVLVEVGIIWFCIKYRRREGHRAHYTHGSKSLEVLWTATTRTRSGVPIALGKERWTPYVRDIDSEVAQDSKIGDPKVDRLFEGIRILVEPHALAGSEDNVEGVAAFFEKREPGFKGK